MNPLAFISSPAAAPPALLLAPAAEGWRLLCADGAPSLPASGPRTVESLLASLPRPSLRREASPLVVALPTRCAFPERMVLPSGEREELEGMVLLQFEKTLPYPVEETTHCFDVVSTRRETPAPPADLPEGETGAAGPLVCSTVVAWAVHLPTLESLLAPLLEAQVYPVQMTLWAMHLAACTGPRTGGAFWQEEGEIVFGIFENGKVVFVEGAENPDAAVAAFPQWLLSAELAGAPVRFERIWVDPALDAWRSTFAAIGAAPAEPLPEPGVSAAGLPDLSPPDWRALRRRAESRQRLQKRLLAVAAVYAVLVVALIGWNLFKGVQLRRLEAKLLAAQPQAEERLARELRWRTLAPAIDPDRSTVELLFRVYRNLPSPQVRITGFEQTPGSFMVTGEAPSAAEAVGFLEKMKASDAFAEFDLHADPPTLLPNDHAQFRIFGK